MANKRLIVKAFCTGFGSEERSALCHIEQGCVYFDINGVEYKWFNYDKARQMFKDRTTYDISCTINPELRTLQRVKKIHTVED